MHEGGRQANQKSESDDLVRLDWFDALIGKSLSGGLNGIVVPVFSWGFCWHFGSEDQASPLQPLLTKGIRRKTRTIIKHLCRVGLKSYKTEDKLAEVQEKGIVGG